MSASVINFEERKDFSSQTFTSSGTFVVPANVYRVLVTGCGGGGGGGAHTSTGSAEGGDGAQVYTATVNVTPGASISVTIGSGGTGANGTSPSNATDGGNSQFGSIVFYGARAGRNNLDNGSVFTDAGGNSYGQGGNSVLGPVNGTNAAANTGGGGASGSSTGSPNIFNGGNGGSGIIIVSWDF